jgi:hypothetical protein
MIGDIDENGFDGDETVAVGVSYLKQACPVLANPAYLGPLSY